MWADLDRVLLKSSELAPAEFQPGEDIKSVLRDYARVLVIGAGGLGCEILKDLALSGFRDIEVIDLDRIDITNLNRQFLFRQSDVGSFKSEVAAKFIMERVPECKVKAYTCPIQEFDEEFYSGFHIIIAGLDNIEARRWLNSMIYSMVKFDKDGEPLPETVRPIIDGGTEGFKGQARVVIPYKTACYECTLPMMTPQKGVPMCTIAETPRIPEHCIEYAYIIEWEKAFPNRKVDKDSYEDMNWIYETALERAKAYGIEGVTYMKTMGVVKNIIPAIASTNAIVAAACAAEALKIATYVTKPVDNYFMFMGQTGIHTATLQIEKDPNCLVCSNKPGIITIGKNSKLKDFISILTDSNSKYKMISPSISCGAGILYMPKPPALEEKHRFKLDLTFQELIDQGFYGEDFLTVTDQTFINSMNFNLVFRD
ncbi:unnamed protein product [Blepharisma stoltei]|uniref:NEDD8-activating enzyme E1 catalytic subunit n=1 Tax=Blepharisma stoltei TaxID=1481888 RepID=A0AAU9JB92_9CILI|nr:unnamed protein product [Blepharisma stoltei]